MMEQCPNCERPMRLITRRVSLRKPCEFCGRGFPEREGFEYDFWKCDHCEATIHTPEQMTRMRDLHRAMVIQ
jgi:ribosomal protein L37AE/L43A